MSRFMVDVSTYAKEMGKHVESFPFDTMEEAVEYVERSRRYDCEIENGDFRRTFEPREVKA